MKTMQTKSQDSRLKMLGISLLFGTAALLAACGGGGSGTDSTAAIGSGGTAAAAQGPISGFGSVIVNGVRFDDNGATVTIDDNGGLSNQLKLGMMVQIEGTSGATTGTASSITASSHVQGPIDAPLTNGTLTVLGITIDVNASTIIEDATGKNRSLSSLGAGQIIEVYGLVRDTNHITATRIEMKMTTEVRSIGAIQGLTPTSFTLNGIKVNYTSGALDSNLGAGLVAEKVVRVKGTMSGGEINATKVKPVNLTPVVKEAQHVELEGLVSNVSGTNFEIQGLKIDASKVTPAVSVKAGDRVEVEGTVINGVLVTTNVKPEDESIEAEVQLFGTVADFKAADHTFTMRSGTETVHWTTGSTEFLSPLTEAALANNLKVEVKGIVVNGRVEATRIKINT